MPIAVTTTPTRSRSRSARTHPNGLQVNLEHDIEDDRDGMDVDGEDEEEVPVFVNRRRPADQLEAGGDAEQDEEEEGLSVDTYVAKPVVTSQSLIRTLEDSLKNNNSQLQNIDNGIKLLLETAVAIADCARTEDEPALKPLETSLKSYLDQQSHLRSSSTVLKSLIARLKGGEELFTPVEDFKTELDTKRTAYLALSDRQKYAKSKEFETFHQDIWEVFHPDEGAPPVGHWLAKGDDEESDDDEIQVGGQTQHYRCPLTLTPFEECTISTVCNHSFSGPAIRDHIRQNQPRAAKCPVAGCDREIRMGDLKPNPTLQKKSDAAQGRARRREEEGRAARDEGADVID